ncbi:MAG: hypothetical protein KDC44_04200, partial [Phaeodactylibacter sp.]|nr:hypothetical protein [Phaeodactylibacter sp.]
MISSLRQNFNANFTQERYQELIDWVTAQYNHRPVFRMAETPVFVPDTMKAQLFEACELIS